MGSAGTESVARTPQRALGRPPAAAGCRRLNTATGCSVGAQQGGSEATCARSGLWYEPRAVPYERGQRGHGRSSQTARRTVARLATSRPHVSAGRGRATSERGAGGGEEVGRGRMLTLYGKEFTLSLSLLPAFSLPPPHLPLCHTSSSLSKGSPVPPSLDLSPHLLTLLTY